MAAYGPVLGKFITLDDYFAHTTSAGELTSSKPMAIALLTCGKPSARRDTRPILRTADEHALDAPTRRGRESGDARRPIEGARGNRARRDGRNTRRSHGATRTGGRAHGCCARAWRPKRDQGSQLLNPLSFDRRVVVDVSSLASLPAVGGAIVAVQESAGKKWIVADVPGMGFCHVRPATVGAPKKKPKPIAAEHTLANEHLRVEISPTSGGLHSIHDLNQRGNRLSSQVALRKPPPRPKPGDLWRDPEEGAEYSSMVADSLEIAENGPAVGVMITRGRLVDAEGKRLAGYTLRYQLAAGSRVITIDTELEIDHEPKATHGKRTARRGCLVRRRGDLSRAVSMAVVPTDARQFETPPPDRTAHAEDSNGHFDSGGLPYHRRSARGCSTHCSWRRVRRGAFSLRHWRRIAVSDGAGARRIESDRRHAGVLPDKGPEAAWLFRLTRVIASPRIGR